MKKRSVFLPTSVIAGFFAAALSFSVFAAPVTEEKAKSIALEHAGVKSEDVTFVLAEQEYDDKQHHHRYPDIQQHIAQFFAIIAVQRSALLKSLYPILGPWPLLI